MQVYMKTTNLHKQLPHYFVLCKVMFLSKPDTNSPNNFPTIKKFFFSLESPGLKNNPGTNISSNAFSALANQQKLKKSTHEA